MRFSRSIIRPGMIRLKPDSVQKFSLQPASSPAQWSVDGIPDGNHQVGTIDSNGVYRAPVDPPRREHVIEARVGEGKHLSSWATVILEGPGPLYECVTFWNRKGEGPDEMAEAHGIALESSGNLLVADPLTARIIRFSPSGKYLGEIGKGKKNQPGGLDGPRDLKVHENGEVYVIDGNLCQVKVFDSSGRFLRCWGGEGEGRCEMMRPHSLAISRDGLVHVADVGNNRVIVFDGQGTQIRCWGARGTGHGEFLAPHGICTDPNGDVFVAEFDGRCQKFDSKGNFLFQFANPGSTKDATHGHYRYHAMASDDLGNIYLMARDNSNNYQPSIDKYNNNGKLVTRFRTIEQTDTIEGAKGAAISADGTIYIAEAGRELAGVSIFRPA